MNENKQMDENNRRTQKTQMKKKTDERQQHMNEI